MPRKALIRSKEHPYHVTARANNKKPFAYPLEKAWPIYLNQLAELEARFKAKTHAFVLMPNHFHLLISTPDNDLGNVMQHFMRSVTKILNSRSEQSGRVFGARYHWSIIQTTHYFDCALKYVYRNPVKAALIAEAQGYCFSTLHPYANAGENSVRLHPIFGEKDIIPHQNLEDFLRWVNTPFRTEQDRELKKALTQTTFLPFTTRRSTKYAIRDERYAQWITQQ